MSKGEDTYSEKVSEKSALKQPTRIFKMPAPKPPVMTNPFKMTESVETFGAKQQKSIDTIRKRSSIGDSEAAQKLSEEKAPKKSLPEDEVKKAQEAMRNMFKSLQKPKGENWEFLFRTPYIMKGPVYDQVASINLEKVNIIEV